MKGAAVVDLIIVITLITTFFIIALFAKTTWDDISSEDTVFAEQSHIKSYVDQNVSMIGSLGVILFGGAIAALAIMSFLQQSHPVFLVISVIVLIVSIPLMVIQSNIAMEVATSTPALEAAADSYPMATEMMANLLIWGVVGAIIILAALYSKFGGGR